MGNVFFYHSRQKALAKVFLSEEKLLKLTQTGLFFWKFTPLFFREKSRHPHTVTIYVWMKNCANKRALHDCGIVASQTRDVIHFSNLLRVSWHCKMHTAFIIWFISFT